MYNPNRFAYMNFKTNDPLENSFISELASYREARALHNSLRDDTNKESQCFNRAHVWTYETLLNKKKQLGKVWIFFTDKFIKRYQYKWWFHIAPYTKLTDQSKLVLDRTYAKKPLTPRRWASIFIGNNHGCPEIKDYKHYEESQDSEYCYSIYTSQYYWQPWNIEILSKQGLIAFGYNLLDLEIAYNDSIKNWSGVIGPLQ